MQCEIGQYQQALLDAPGTNNSAPPPRKIYVKYLSQNNL